MLRQPILGKTWGHMTKEIPRSNAHLLDEVKLDDLWVQINEEFSMSLGHLGKLNLKLHILVKVTLKSSLKDSLIELYLNCTFCNISSNM